MKKLLISLVTVGAVGVAAFAATSAFFSDEEVSTGNVLAAGAIDLKVDNTCYYNGMACVGGLWAGNVGIGGSQPCNCTWESKDLVEGDVFFDFSDLKPGDWEEDTLSLTVEDNDAWVCADINVTQHIDVSCTDPEVEFPDPDCPDTSSVGGVGEIAEELNFIFWADDGDNVLETDETEGIITQGPASSVLDGARWAIADSENSVLGLGSPLVGAQTYYVGKAFCYGELTLAPVTPGEHSPTVDPGIECDGSGVGNISQTDSLSGEIVFEAVQARNNDDFLCNPESSPSPTPTPTPTPGPTPPG